MFAARASRLPGCLITSDFLAVNELAGIATKIAANATMTASGQRDAPRVSTPARRRKLFQAITTHATAIVESTLVCTLSTESDH